jgi:hypothetical protein
MKLLSLIINGENSIWLVDCDKDVFWVVTWHSVYHCEWVLFVLWFAVFVIHQYSNQLHQKTATNDTWSTWVPGIFLGVKGSRCLKLTTRKCGSLDVSQPYAPPWPLTGIASPPPPFISLSDSACLYESVLYICVTALIFSSS